MPATDEVKCQAWARSRLPSFRPRPFLSANILGVVAPVQQPKAIRPETITESATLAHCFGQLLSKFYYCYYSGARDT